jgi:hypothetical protein
VREDRASSVCLALVCDWVPCAMQKTIAMRRLDREGGRIISGVRTSKPMRSSGRQWSILHRRVGLADAKSGNVAGCEYASKLALTKRKRSSIRTWPRSRPENPEEIMGRVTVTFAVATALVAGGTAATARTGWAHGHRFHHLSPHTEAAEHSAITCETVRT